MKWVSHVHLFLVMLELIAMLHCFCWLLSGLPDLVGSSWVWDPSRRAIHHPREWRRPLGGVCRWEEPSLPQTLHNGSKPRWHGGGPLAASRMNLQLLQQWLEEICWFSSDYWQRRSNGWMEPSAFRNGFIWNFGGKQTWDLAPRAMLCRTRVLCKASVPMVFGVVPQHGKVAHTMWARSRILLAFSLSFSLSVIFFS